ncbi:hypothetical protein V6N12_030476 [Hibiscus sabdariffa]|uniref:Reverse transcriptase zinc-binding domain-containing protein n=1 Tax=Hibiscus sabdariffa TaxID=183260 RepID=A0ABR1ZIH5_9ROSI
MVSDLIVRIDNSWKYEVLNGLFDVEMVSRICSIPVSQTYLLDEIVWRGDGFGNYSVKSSYRVLCAEQSNTLHGDFSVFFIALWVITVPAKVKITMWRIVNNFIPHFRRVQIRRLQVTSVCPSCQTVGETVEHLMRDCMFVQQLMRKLKLLVASIQDEGQGRPLREWWDETTLVLSWPHVPFNMRMELGFSKVIIEGDSLTVIKKLNSNAVDRSVICPIVHNIKILSKDFSSISFCFVRRGANKATHALAHECGSNHGPCYWIEKAPVATMTECGLDRSRLVQVHVP